MKIFLGNSPWLDQNDPTKYGVRAGSRWPHFQPKKADEKIGCYVPFPHFLATAAAVLETAGEDVLLIDGIAEGIRVEEFIGKIKGYSPDIILLEVSTPSIAYDLQIAGKIRYQCPNAKIAFSGIHAPMQSEGFLNENPIVDFVLFGEYEYTLRDLIHYYKNGKSYKDVQGLIFRGSNGEIIKNEPRPLIQNLDDLPFYAHHFLPMKNYQDAPCGLPFPSVQMWTSRGCPFRCSFCAWPQIMYGGNKYRVRSISKILDELEILIGAYGFKSFYFDDDTVNIGKKRMMELCDEIKKRGINLPWAIMARADTMDEELLRSFKDAGLYSLKYGVESGDQDLVNASGKKLDLQKVRETLSITHELGIKTHLTFAFGLPGETKETIKKTIAFALELDSDSIQFSIVTPFPGSRHYDLAKEKGWLITEDWGKFNGSTHSVVRTENLSAADLEEALAEAYRMWEKHKSNGLKRKVTKTGEEILKKAEKTLIMRSSFMSHFEEVLDLIYSQFTQHISVLGQPIIKEKFLNDPRIEKIFIYEKGFFNSRDFAPEILNDIIKESFDTILILYNHSPKETYAEVELIAQRLKPKKIIGIDPLGRVSKLDG